MQSVNTGLTVVNETDVRGQALLNLIRQNISFSSSLYGFRPIGVSESIQFPALFVEPKSQTPRMVSTAKYQIEITYGIYWYIRDNVAEDAVTLSSFIGEALIKLFSNNAQSSASPTNQYKQYSGYWLDSEMISVDWSVSYLDPKVSGMQYERQGRMLFKIMDIILK